MAMINSNILNILLLIVLLVLAALDSTIRSMFKCTNFLGIMYGVIFGAVIGALWYTFLANVSPKSLYYDEYVSNKVACSVPKKQDFVCRLYKNGEEVDTIATNNSSDGTHNHNIDIN